MKNKEPNNKKRVLIVLLLLLIIAAVLFFYFKKEKKPAVQFTQQGESTIGAGNISLKIWDSEAEDGDTVQLYFKEKLMADTLAILNEPVTYPLGNLTAGDYWIGVSAINEGASSPATAQMSVSNGQEEITFSMDAWVDSAASWKLVIK